MDVSNPKRRKISRIAHPVNHDFPLQKLDQFELQITELLYQLQPNFAKCMVKAESTLRKLKLTIESLPSRDPLPVRYTRVLIRCYGAYILES